MSVAAFDTLSAARKLEAAGVERRQAEAHAEALREAVGAGRDSLATKADLADFATKADLARVRDELRTELAGVRDELRADLAGVRDELRADIVGVRDELRTELASKADLAGFATKADIVGVRDELRAELASKADLARFVTKADLADFKAEMFKVAIGVAVGVVLANATLTAVLVFGALQLLRP